MVNQSLSKLERLTADSIRKNSFKGKRLLVAVSGGVDSMALLKCLIRVQDFWNVQLTVAHVHHGDSSDLRQKIFRDVCESTVLEVCKREGIPFFSKKLNLKDGSESEYRVQRRAFFLELLAEVHADAIVTAHHSNDLLETRLIRLVRGIGPQGIRAISELSGKWFRPWLKVSKEQIVDYANTESVEFLSDPSNGEDRYLRNFMRNTWLPLLEKKRPGSTKSLSRSLEILSEMSAAKDVSEGDSQYNILVSESGIDRMAFTALSREDQRKVLARFFKLNNLLNYTEGHISEVIKRLDSDKKQFQFRTARCNWVVNASHICLGSAE